MIGKAEGVADLSALTLMIVKEGTYFLADTHVTYEPSAEELVEMTLMSAKVVRADLETNTTSARERDMRTIGLVLGSPEFQYH